MKPKITLSFFQLQLRDFYMIFKRDIKQARREAWPKLKDAIFWGWRLEG